MASVANVVEILVKSTNQTAAGFDEAKAGAEEAGAGMDAYAAAADKAQAAVDELASASARLAEVQGSDKASAEELAAAQDAYAAALDKSNAATAAAVDAQAKLAAAEKDSATTSAAAGDATAATAAKNNEAGAAAAGMGSKMKMAGIAVAVGMGAAVKAAADFQDSTTHLVTDAGESAKNLAMVQQGILAVSAATGQSASSITDAMYHVESSGFHAASGLAVLKTVAEGARVGGADLDTTSKALVGTLTAYYGTSMTAAQATQRSTSLMNQLIATVGSGDMRMQDLAASLHSVAPIAAAAGISFAQVGGAIATMTAQGISADQATQDLGHVIGSLSNPTNVMAVEMKAMGLNANTVAKNIGTTGLAGTLNELRDAVLSNTQGGSVMLGMLRGMTPAAQGLSNQILAGTISTGDLTKAMKTLNPQQEMLVSHFKSAATSVTGLRQTYTAAMSKMTGGQMGLNVALMLTNSHAKDLAAATANITAEGKKATTQVDNWSTIQGTFAFKTAQAKTALKDTGIALGSALLPAVSAVLGPLAHLLAVIAGNKAASIALAVVVGGLLAGALGGKLAKSLKDASEGIKSVGDGIGWLIGKLTAQTAATEAQTAATEAATVAQEEMDVAESANPIGLIILAIAALIAIIVLLVTHWKTVWKDMKAVLKDAADFFKTVFTDIAHAAEVPIDWIKSHWPLLLAILTGPIGLAVLYITTHFKQITSAASQLYHDVTSWASRLANDFGHWIEEGVDKAVSWFKGLPGRIVNAVGNLGSLLFNAGKNVIQGLINGIMSMVGSVGNAIGSVAGEIKNFLPFSPAKKGPLSGSGAPENSGRSIGRLLAQGMESGLPQVRAAAGRMAGAAGLGGAAGGMGAAGAGGGTLRVQLEFASGADNELIRGLRNYIRVKGGNVQKVIGAGAG